MADASRLQHDTLDQIREHLELILGASRVGFGNLTTWAHFNEEHATAALAKFDALLAEGRIDTVPVLSGEFGERVLVIPLLVGVGCGNAKKDTP